MEMKNGWAHTATAPSVEGSRAVDHLNTKGVTVAFRHPTPRQPTLRWSCEGYDDPEVFDPADERALAEAQAVCGNCAVRALCLDLGLGRDEWGVWGGVLLENGKPVDRVRPRGPTKRAPAA